MLLEGRNALLYGAAGSIGGAVARAFAVELGPHGIRAATLEDAGNLAAFVASDRAKAMTAPPPP